MDTTLTSAPVARTAPDRKRALFVGAITTAVAIAGVLWAVLKSGTTNNHELSSLPYVAGAALIVAVALFAWLAPMRIAAHGSGLPFAIVSVPLLVAYWSALPLLVAVAGILIGVEHRAAAGSKPGRALTAIIIGSVVAVISMVGILFG